MSSSSPDSSAAQGFVDAASFGFSPDASGLANVKALQAALDRGGSIVVSVQGTYKIASTLYVGSDTSLIFGAGVFLKKVDEKGPFAHVVLNKGALTRTFDERISIEGLNLSVNGVLQTMGEILGLRGQVAFFYVKDLRITKFRCLDVAGGQYCIHVCRFENLIVDDAVIKGDKDGVHLGCGKRFAIRNCVFQTFDDSIALNAHDYASGNPEMGWIEDGVIENCHDLAEPWREAIGFFCRILAGAWLDWTPGMEVQNSDSVVCNGRLYRVFGKPDGVVWKSVTPPSHEKGLAVLDGINWGMIQPEPVYSAGVRNVSFRDIFLSKPRIGFSVHFDEGAYSRSFYPGSKPPKQEGVFIEGVRVLYKEPTPLVSVNTPIDAISISNSSLGNNRVEFRKGGLMPDYFRTAVNIHGCVFNHDGEMDLLTSEVETAKEIVLKTSCNVESSASFKARVVPGKSKIAVDSDLAGLRK